MYPAYLGLARSILIYYGKPFRTRNLCRLYAGFLRPGDLAFDIGAHVGSHIRAFTRMGVRVVALEPQPLFFRFLERFYGHQVDVHLLAEAVGRYQSTQLLYVSPRTPTVSTLSRDWIAGVSGNPAFHGVRWDDQHQVPVTTLDLLIARFGLPAFCKLDIEGSELAALEGLTTPLPALSLEYVPGALQSTWRCLARLDKMGPYAYNWTRGERLRLESPVWVSSTELEERLNAQRSVPDSGDIFARLRQN